MDVPICNSQDQIPNTLNELAEGLRSAKRMRWLIVAIVTLIPACFWLYSDKHNSELFVAKDRHVSDITDISKRMDKESTETSHRLDIIVTSIAANQNLFSTDHDTILKMSRDLEWIREKLSKPVQ